MTLAELDLTVRALAMARSGPGSIPPRLSL
jgi:hypothetical protein